MKKIRVGCIGTGGISASHLDYLRRREDCEIVALCDVNPDALEQRRRTFGGKAWSDFRAMLSGERLDAVWLCTPPSVRGEPLIACAERGIPVFCEKPAERDEGRAKEIATRLEQLGGHVQVGYLFRSLPPVQRLRDELQKDKVHLVQSFYGCNMSLQHVSRTWFYDKALSGGALVDQATHNLDLLRYLFGEIVQVCGVAANPVHAKSPGYTVEEVLAFSFLFEEGAVGSHTHTWVGDTWRNEIHISGEKRYYRLNLNRRALVIEEGTETWQLVDNERSMMDYEDDAFLEMVTSGDWSRNPSSYSDAVRTLQTTVAFDRALVEGMVRL